ncbi:peptidase C14, caspase domain-containing protein [Desarmillaria ectypa]|nr:peptidase C14, caspase domain-containing protein [Desarmillaria ectypa]
MIQATPPTRDPARWHDHFQYSKCTGRKKALCIGINYHGQSYELQGCINDTRHLRDFLIGFWDYKAEDITLLVDENMNPSKQPTRENIIQAMHWLVQDVQPHDSLFFLCTSLPLQTLSSSDDEVDGLDEAIYPADFVERGHILDDDMHQIMVKPLPTGCRLTVFECCHSGTALDLPYVYDCNGRLKGQHVTSHWISRRSTPADVITWSGSKDGQTSADTFHGGVAVGAMSWAFIQSLTKNQNQSYQGLLHSIRKILQPEYSQVPQLGSSHHIDTNLRFIL